LAAVLAELLRVEAAEQQAREEAEQRAAEAAQRATITNTTETNPLVLVNVSSHVGLGQEEVTMLPRLATPPSKVRCKNVALVVLTVALLCAATAIVTMTVSSTSSDAPSSVPSTTSRQEASGQVHDLRAARERVQRMHDIIDEAEL
jgi:hypothetical protein